MPEGHKATFNDLNPVECSHNLLPDEGQRHADGERNAGAAWQSLMLVAALALIVLLPVSLRHAVVPMSSVAAALGIRTRFSLGPVKGPLVRESSLFDDAYREEMFWGTYRPGFYCGARLVTSKTFLPWSAAPLYQCRQESRHDAL